MTDLLLLLKIFLTLAIGALIGIERQKRAKGEIVAGIRTFMLVCLFGLLSSYLSSLVNNFLPLYIGFFTVGCLSIASYITKYLKKKSIGLTTEIAFILTFVIGIIAFFESYPYLLTISLGIILTLILFSLESLHKFARHLTKKEIWNAIIFAIVAFVVLPILPNKPIDPFGALNPYVIWFAVVLVLTISFVSYIFMKVLGVKYGLGITGLLGGLASSTSVAVSMSEKVRENRKLLYSAVFAVLVASSTMFLRQVLVVALFNFNILPQLVFPMFLLATFGFISSFYIWRKCGKEKGSVRIGSPLALKSALKFAIIFTLTLLITNLSQKYFGEISIYPLVIIAGLVDVDAITISLAASSINGLSPVTAINGIIIAGLSNTFYKWFYVNWLGTKKMSLEVGKVFGMIILLGVIILLLSTII